MSTPSEQVDPSILREQLEAVRADRAIARKRRYSRSRLDRYRAEIEVLASEGASWREITTWLRKHKRVKVSPTTVGRRLHHWRAQ